MKYACFILFSILFGCASPYRAQTKEYGSGYTDEKISDRVYKISYQGNSHTADEVVYKYFMRRCAEVALNNHFPYFIVIESKDITKTTSVPLEEDYKPEASVVAPNISGEIDYRPYVYKRISSHALVGKIALFKEKDRPMNAIKVEDILKDVKY